MYRAGIIGCGRMGCKFDDDPLKKKPSTHAGAYKASKRIKLVAACDIKKDRLGHIKDGFGPLNIYTNYKKMINTENLDIVSVCTHASLHARMVIDAAESGISGIFCEKPISTNLTDAEKMINTCKKTGSILMINHTRRWDPKYRTVKTLINNGKIGKVKTVQCCTTSGLLNGGTHLFDTLRYFVGDPDWIFAQIKPDTTQDKNGIGIIKFKSGAYAFIDCDFREYLLFELRIIGECGMINSGGMIRGSKNFELFIPKSSRFESGIKELTPSGFPPVSGPMPMLSAVEEIVDCIENKKPPSCGGNDGKAALEMALAFHESYKKGKKIKFPLKNKKLSVVPRETSFTVSGKIEQDF